MTFDFDRAVDRTGTDSEKWHRYAGRDVLPLWVADMDFVSPPAVLAALRERVDHGVFGYGHATADQTATACAALDRLFGWEVDPAWLVWLPGLVTGLSVTCRAVGEPGDGVVVNTPVYPPFLSVPGLMDRTVETVPLAGDNTAGWSLDAGAMRAGLSPNARLYLLCHPHNPVGRSWRRDELEGVAEVCLEKDLVVCSDEIHNELVVEPELVHEPLALAVPGIASRTVTLLAPSKTYNIAGLGCSLAVIEDDSLRRRFRHAMAGIVPHPNVLGLTAAAAAWREGESWRQELLAYLRGNRDALVERLTTTTRITAPRIEATYLAWLDVRHWSVEDAAAHAERHGLGLSDGAAFGAPGYLRLNFGCPRERLLAACDRLAAADAAAG